MPEDRVYDSDELFDLLEEMPSGWPKAHFLEEAIRMADEADDLEGRICFRECLFDEVIELDYPRVIPIMAELDAIFEAEPSALSEYRITNHLYNLAAAIESIMEVPEVSLEQWLSMADSYRTLLKRFGKGERSYWYMMVRIYRYVDRVKALALLDKLWDAAESGTDECVPCLHATSAIICLENGAHERAEEHIEVVESGREGTCPESKQWCLLARIDLLLDEGSPDEAAPLAKRLLRIGNRYPNDKDYIGAAIRCFSYTDPDKALSLFQKRLIWTIGATDLLGLFDFYRGAWALMHTMATQNDKIKMRLPQDFEEYRSDGTYDPAALEAWFADKLENIAHRLDARNENAYMMTAVKKLYASMNPQTEGQAE